MAKAREDTVRELVEQALADCAIVGGPSESVLRLFIERAFDAGHSLAQGEVDRLSRILRAFPPYREWTE